MAATGQPVEIEARSRAQLLRWLTQTGFGLFIIVECLFGATAMWWSISSDALDSRCQLGYATAGVEG